MKNKIWYGFIFSMIFVNSSNIPQLKYNNIEEIQSKIQQLIENTNINIKNLIIELCQKFQLEVSDIENINTIENTITSLLSTFNEVTKISEEYESLNELFNKINEKAIKKESFNEIINEIIKIANKFIPNLFIFNPNSTITNTLIELQKDPYLTEEQIKNLKIIEEKLNKIKTESICNIEEKKLNEIQEKIKEIFKKIQKDFSTKNLEKKDIKKFLKELQTTFLKWKSNIEYQKKFNEILQSQKDLNKIKNKVFSIKMRETMKNLNQKLLNKIPKDDNLNNTNNALIYLINQYIPSLSNSISEQLEHLYQYREEMDENEIKELDKLFEKNTQTAKEFNLFKKLLSLKDNKEDINEINNVCRYKTILFSNSAKYTNIDKNTVAINFINQISQTYIEEEYQKIGDYIEEYQKIGENKNDYLLNYFLNEKLNHIKIVEEQTSQEQEQEHKIKNNRDQHIKILYGTQNKLQKENIKQQNIINQLQKEKKINKKLDMIVIGGVITLVICFWIYDTYYKTKTMAI